MGYPLGEKLKALRKQKELGVRELCELTEKNSVCGRTVSPAYYSQVENCTGIRPEKISFDFFWAVSVILETDPVELFVLSRQHIPQQFAKERARNFIFGTGPKKRAKSA